MDTAAVPLALTLTGQGVDITPGYDHDFVPMPKTATENPGRRFFFVSFARALVGGSSSEPAHQLRLVFAGRGRENPSRANTF